MDTTTIQNLTTVINSVSWFAVIFKTSLGIVITMVITRVVSKALKSSEEYNTGLSEVRNRVVQLEAHNTVNIEYREISKTQRAEINAHIKQLELNNKDTNTKINNLAQKFNEVSDDLFSALKITPKKRVKFLIFDDHPTSSDVLKNKLLQCGDFSIKLCRKYSEAQELLKTSEFNCIFSDLIHPVKQNTFFPLGLRLHKYVKETYPKTTFVLYSVLEKPIDYKGYFIPKSITIPSLKNALKKLQLIDN